MTNQNKNSYQSKNTMEKLIVDKIYLKNYLQCLKLKKKQRYKEVMKSTRKIH